MKAEKIITETEEFKIVGAALLSIGEAEALPLHLRKYYNWWWLQSRGSYRNHAANVRRNGFVNDCGCSIDYANGRVRPSLEIENIKYSNLKVGDRFDFGGEAFEIISDTMAFCLEDIGACVFREDWRVENANDYEKSDIKKFVDNWFEKARNADD